MIRAIITDFDGTLVDTFEANYLAYQKAFQSVGLDISKDKYRECFGLRFDRLMNENGIFDSEIISRIKEAKKEFYPDYFSSLKINRPLTELVRAFRSMGGKTAIASTARKENLQNAINYLGISDLFDVIFAGVDVKQGKPSPEIYNKAMESLGVPPEETLIFEDSEVGIESAKASGAQCIIVDQRQFR